jgi:sugar transferase (PEP-CTERM/EpsH1 system associated)
VDSEYFAPDREYPNPYPAGEQALAFTGAMDYRANVDAVCWFAREVFPEIRRAVPDAGFSIVGARPVAEVRQLAELPGVRVTGTVPDVRPWLAHARLAVAPLRIARGVQNKVLEAMAMARPVLATRAAMEGIVPCPDLERWVVRSVIAEDDEPSASEFVQAAVRWLAERAESERLGRVGRDWVLRHYHWETNLSQFVTLLEEDAA